MHFWGGKTTLFSKYYYEVKWCPILTICLTTKAVIFKLSCKSTIEVNYVPCWTCIFLQVLVYAIT
jgi:hypothetical protein